MRSQTFTKLACACVILAVSAGPKCFADSVITSPTPADASLSMLQIEQELFGFDPADGYSIAQQSQLWTTNANAALYANLFALITTLGGDQAAMAELFQPGAIFAGQTNPFTATQSQALVSIQETSFQSSLQSSVPEPATMGLLGGALLLLCCYAGFRTGRINEAVRSAQKHSDGPIQRAD